MWVEEVNGKYKFCERYTDPLTLKQKKVSVTLDKNTSATRKLAADELQRKIESKCSSVSYDNITLQQLFDLYSDFQSKSCKKSTCERNNRTLSRLVSLFGQDSIVDNLTVAYVNNKLMSITTNPTTLNEYIRRFKAMLNWGYSNDYIKTSTLSSKLKRFNDKTNKEKLASKYLEQDEITTLLDEMKSKPDWYYLTYFQILTGMRIGEILALETKDIKEDIIHINKTYDTINQIVTTPKTMCSIRDIYIQKELQSLIKKIKLYEKEKRMLYGIRSNLLFCSSSGSFLAYYSYNKYLREVCLRLFNKKVTTHTLRHTHASLLLAEGVSIDAISRRLGHENSNITKEIYLHVVKKLKEKDNNEIKNIKLII